MANFGFLSKYLPKLQLGDINADNCTSLEVLLGLLFKQKNYICANFFDCFKLDQNIFEDIVEDVLLNINQVDQHVQLLYTGSEIPKCFNFQSMGSIISVELPIHWSKNNFLGFATCFVFSNNPINLKTIATVIRWEYNFKSKDGHPCVRDGYFWNAYVWNSYFWGGYYHQRYVYSNHVLVEYPILPFSFHELGSENKVSFQFHLDHSSSFEIEKCGVHLIFGQHLEEVDGSSRVGEEEDVDELQMIDGDTSLLIKIIKALCVNCFGFGSVE